MSRTVVVFLLLLVVMPVIFAEVSNDEIVNLFTKDEIIDLVIDTHEAPARMFLLKSLNNPMKSSNNPTRDDPSFRVVFLCEGERYTFDWNWWVGGIQVWIASEDRLTLVFADTNIDGVVDFGTDGLVRVFSAEGRYPDSKAEGLEYQIYWQEIYDDFLLVVNDFIHQ